MLPFQEIKYGKFDNGSEWSSNKFGEFSEVLGDKEQKFISSLIWASYELTKEADSKLYCCFTLPVFGKNRILDRLNDANISYFFANSDIKEKMPIITCESAIDLDAVILNVWGDVRLVFIASNSNDTLELIEPDWVETLESMPSEIVDMVDVVVTQFFHGLWLEVTTRKYSSSSKLFDDIRNSIVITNNVKYIQQFEW